MSQSRLIEASEKASRSGWQRGGDVLPVLLVYVFLLYGIPSELVIAPLGAAGTPAQVVGMLMFAWWAFSQLLPKITRQQITAVHWLLLIFATAIASSYVTGMSRPVFSILEVNSADRGILSLLSWCGVILVIADGIATRDRLRSLLRAIAVGAVFIAVLGCLQFFFGLDLARYIKVPGLSVNSNFGELFDRSGYRRVSGTTSHPIEFGVVLSAALPLVIHFARFAPTRRQAVAWWCGALVVAGALPLSVARSAIIGGTIAILYLFHTWPAKLRLRALIVGVAGTLVMSVVVPGLLGTIRGLFLNAGSDPSTQGRTADYGPVFAYFSESPLLGRGFGTFIPGVYRTLDNAYLGLVVEAGLLGVTTFLALLVGAVIVAGQVRRQSADETTRDLAQCLKAGIVVVAVDAATFDALGFAACVGTLMLLVGAVAALRRSSPAVGATRDASRADSWGRVPVATVLAMSLLGATISVFTPRSEYSATARVLLAAPQVSGLTAFSQSGNTAITASLLHDVLASAPVRESIEKTTPGSYEVAIGDASLMMGTDDAGFGPFLAFDATAPSVAQATRMREALLSEASTRLSRMQLSAGVAEEDTIRVEPYSASGVDRVPVPRSRAIAAYGLLMGVMCLVYLSARRPRRRSPASSAVRNVAQVRSVRHVPQAKG